MMSVVYILQIGVFILLTVVNCELFTAIINVDSLLHTHQNVLRNLEQYIEVEENRLNVLKWYLKKFTNEQEKAITDAQKYVENPFNAFILIKTLATDFERLKTITSDTTEFVWDPELLYPTEEDLTGAAVAIARLQYFYKLNTTQLAEGNLKGIYGVHLLSEIGQHYGNPAALKNEVVLQSNCILKIFNKSAVFNRHLVFTVSLVTSLLALDNKMDTPMSASDCYNLALMLYNQGGPYNYPYATQWFKVARERLGVLVNETLFITPEKYHTQYTTDDIEDIDSVEKQYHELCRDDINIPSAQASKLAPIKMEVLLMNPVVFLFHDVLADNEIEIMKTIAATKMKRARVMRHGQCMLSEDRTGKFASLDEYNNTVKIVKRRTADFTGLGMVYAERIQVLNYGIGGHFDPHYDQLEDDGLGIRIATVLFYMSDVNQGGSTVFPLLQLAVKPKKGAALFWRNVHPTGEVDERMLHACCPVLYGRKWVANLWLRVGQESVLLCPLKVD